MKTLSIIANTTYGFLGIFFLCFTWGVRIGWFAFHILTVLIMYGRHGILGAIIGFILPFVSEVYAIAMVLWYQGINNFYMISLGVLLALTFIPYGIAAIIGCIIERKK